MSEYLFWILVASTVGWIVWFLIDSINDYMDEDNDIR